MKPEFAGEGKTVVVVGAGILGVSSSYYLLKKGFNVILLEKRS
jgi:glycine/D-amino acid oxidase-like deaminating enzyme